MLDETKAIKAKDIVDEPDEVYGLMRSHIMISDTSVNSTFSNLMDAIEIMVNAGWEVVNMTNNTTYMFVLVKNLNFKRKNG